LGALDLAIVLGYLASVVAIGAFFSRRQSTTKQYFTAGGKVPWWAVSASIVATETSTVTFLSVPGTAYARGGNFTFLQLALGYVVGRIVVSVLFIPMYFKGELLTVYQLLTTRFGAGVRALLAGSFVVMRTVGDGIRLVLTAGVLAAVWRAFAPSMDQDAVTIGACVSLGLVMILFTLWGGMEAVIWIEVGQLVVYLLGALVAAAILITKIPGGLEAARAVGEEYHKTRWLDFTLSFDKSAGTTFWAGLVGGCFLNMSTHGTDQYLVQRYLCVDRPRKAALALLVSGVVVFFQFALFLGIGLLLFARGRPYAIPNYESLPPAAPFAKSDAVFTDFITHGLPSGVSGFVVAAILAAALSSSLNSIAATVVSDLARPFRAPRRDIEWLRISKWLTIAAGAAQIAVAIAARDSQQSALESVLTVAGLVNGPVLGIFLLGTFAPRAGRGAGIVGLLAGMAAALGAWNSQLYWAWYTAVGALATLGAGAAASIALPRRQTTP
jgi:SSS family transporter